MKLTTLLTAALAALATAAPPHHNHASRNHVAGTVPAAPTLARRGIFDLKQHCKKPKKAARARIQAACHGDQGCLFDQLAAVTDAACRYELLKAAHLLG